MFEERTPEGARLLSVPMKVNIWPGSYVSSSLFSRVVTEKFVRGVTIYSMEDEYRRRGIGLCREAMSRWIIHFSENAFRAFCDHLGRELDEPICPAIGRFAMSDHKVGIMKDKPCIMNAGRKT